jgi:methylenetetrahydrofolate dehydrogenase (NADP+) / methenyltetrahydrofolate cyclohydrolase
MIVFEGYRFAADRERALHVQVSNLRSEGKKIFIAAILFAEDKGSQLYTTLKHQAADRVGMRYQVHTFSMLDPIEKVLTQLEKLNADPAVTGIIIQKPWRHTWEQITEQLAPKNDFSEWWGKLVSKIKLEKDVDGLHPKTIASVEKNKWQKEKKVLPATVKAVLSILEANHLLVKTHKFIIIGKSDILGKPLSYQLKNLGFGVELLGRKDLEKRIKSGKNLTDGDVVISATGQNKLIMGELLKEGVALIDVGEPKPDIDRESVETIAAFLTPVPGGVGPVTVVSLLENAVDLVKSK